MYNSIFTSAEDLEEALVKGANSVIAFWTGSNIVSGQGQAILHGLITGLDVGTGNAFLYNAPRVITGDVTGFANFSGHMKWDGLINLEYLDVGGIGLEGLTVYGCGSLSSLYADANSMDANALNTLYDSLPDRRGKSAGTIDVSLNSGTGSHDTSAALTKNWSFV